MKKPEYIHLGENELSKLYRDKSVLITGHSGFKGSWLTFILKLYGAKVYGLSLEAPLNLNHSYHSLKIDKLVENGNTQFLDVRSSAFADFLSAHNFDYVFHLAAQAIVSKSFESPYETISTNSIGVLNLLEHFRLSEKFATLVIITSDKCYANDNSGKSFEESDVLGGNDPYSSSKAIAEMIVNSYAKTFPDLISRGGLATVRAGNVFGGGDWSENRLIPDCVRQLFNNGLVELRMPYATRPWTLVHDVLSGYLNLAGKLNRNPLQYSGAWNFASGESLTVHDVVKIFVDSIGFGEIRTTDKSIGQESTLLQIDPTKSKNLLDWRPRNSLKTAIAETAHWYENQNQGKDMFEYSVKYVKDFFQE